MSRHSHSLVQIASEQTISNPKLRECWSIFVRAMSYYILDNSDIGEIVEALNGDRDYIVEELGFEIIGRRLRVSFLDDNQFCDLPDMIALLKRLQEDYSRYGE